ncbi:MAG: hypothetical protein ABGX83_01250 [Nitrospira sp.]|nr:hypothetical protein [Candidatus Manganitrophaceae bacterium]HIL35182.1 hypothetical protein [Candidatus Manganitrophaceae bacterium]
MKCQRCQGMMIEERIFTQQGGSRISRCLLCGDIIDTRVIFNRDRYSIHFHEAEREESYQDRLRLSA